MFSYTEMTKRNIGFISQSEQDKLRDATVLVVGTGGMGGACIMALARMGVGHLIIADIDEFEVSNLNRQVFAFTDTVDQHKAEATAAICAKINPDMRVTVYKDDWPSHLADALAQAAIVVNGTDDLGASLLLYRTARAAGKTVVDAYASPFPSVYVTQAHHTPHEQRLGYPTVGTAWNHVTDEQKILAFMMESEWVVLHSSSRHYIDFDAVGDVVSGRRSRMSFGPMVILTGQLMAYEVAAAIFGKPHGADNCGWFLNPYKGRIERPKPAWIAAIMRPIVRRFLAKIAGDQ
jgi:hypothetical protein